MAKKAPKKKAPAKKATKKKAAPKKKAPAKKAVKKRAPAKKAAPKKKAPAKKVAKKAVKKKAPAKKAASKKNAPAKKTVKKKIPAKKTVKKKAPVKRAATKKKAAPKKKAPAKKVVKKKTVTKKATPKKKAPAKKAAAKKVPAKKAAVKKRVAVKKRPAISNLAQRLAPPAPPAAPAHGAKKKPAKLSAVFLKKQKQKLLDLRDTLVDQMNGVARDSLGRGDENNDASAFGMHQADAGSDAYDRDFALNILSQEQDALHEIEEALVRINSGEYGVCQGSGAGIPQARLEAMPFARCTVEYQEKLDSESATGMYRSPVGSLFGLDDKDVAKAADEDE